MRARIIEVSLCMNTGCCYQVMVFILSNVDHYKEPRQTNRLIDLIDIATSICIAFKLRRASVTIVSKLESFTSLHIASPHQQQKASPEPLSLSH